MTDKFSTKNILELLAIKSFNKTTSRAVFRHWQTPPLKIENGNKEDS